MSSYKELMEALPPWRRYATYVLIALAILVLVLIVAGPLRGGVGIAAAIVIVIASFLVGPRSPLGR